MSKTKRNTIRVIITAAGFLIMTLLNYLIEIPLIVNLFIYLGLYLYIGYDVLRKAARSLFYIRMLDENFLMAIATIGAFAISKFGEGVAVMLFYQAGELFQSIAVKKSRKSVAKLMDIRPDSANLVDGNKVIKIDPSMLKVGDIIEIHAGEKIATDAIITKGVSTINTSMLTGESMPVTVNVGDKIISGCINIDGVIRARVEKKYADSTVSKILDLVQSASDKKSKSENFITKFAKVYTPVVVILALVLAIIPPIFVGDWANWIYRALSFLVVSCPCALVISVPLGFFCGIGCASKYGILIKGSTYLEKMSHMDRLVLDKTGTITKGQLKVTNIIANNKNDVIKCARIAECKSQHPIALAIMEFNTKPIDNNYEYNNIIGEGVVARNKETEILCGNYKLMESNNIKCTEIDTFGSVVYVAKNGQYLGAIVVEDEIKEEAADTIAIIKQDGVKVFVLSGDNKTTAQIVSGKVGVNEFYSDLLPDQKILILEEIMKNSNGSTVFVGDGINDSPSLIRSDVGISMGKLGSDCAIEASDIVIMNDKLDNIITTKKIATKTMNIVYENIYFAIGVKVLILILSAIGLSNMWLAVFGDVGVSVLAILNSIRAFFIKK